MKKTVFYIGDIVPGFSRLYQRENRMVTAVTTPQIQL
jgi:hypothetical protein